MKKTTQRWKELGKVEGILQKMEHIQIHHNQMLKKKFFFLPLIVFFSQNFDVVGEPESIEAFDVPPPKKNTCNEFYALRKRLHEF